MRPAARRNALGAAILGQVGQQLVHRAVFGGVDELPAQTTLRDEPSMDELCEMERERGRLHPEPLGDYPGRQTLGAARDEQPEQV